MATRVVLHVGTFKSATTYLQSACNALTAELADRGVLWMGSSVNFAAVRDFDEAAEAGREPVAWKDLLERTRAFEGQVLISNELLSLRTRRRTRALTGQFDPAPVHVVMTAREPGRVMASQWQERARRGRGDSWPAFLERLMSDAEHTDPEATWFWRRQHLPSLVDRFSGVVGVDRITIVTVPSARGRSDQLVSRFLSVLGVDLPAPQLAGVQNASMGAYSIELLRRVQDRLTEEQRERLRIPIKYVLGRSVLTGRRAAEPPIGMNESQHAWVGEYAAGVIDELGESGVRIVGDLDDLRPGPFDTYQGADPAGTSDAHLLDAAVDAIVGLVDAIDRQVRAGGDAAYGEAVRRLAADGGAVVDGPDSDEDNPDE